MRRELDAAEGRLRQIVGMEAYLIEACNTVVSRAKALSAMHTAPLSILQKAQSVEDAALDAEGSRRTLYVSDRRYARKPTD
jgi:hypothetical protein